MFDLNEVNINLSRRGFISCVVPDAATALEKSLEIIGRDSVGIGGSLTVKELGLAERLREAGNAVYWHWTDGPLAKNGAAHADIYVCSANALTVGGIPVLTDGSGNRISAMCNGPRRALLIVGKNKIVGDEREALMRIRSAECAGANAKRLGLHTPCADEGVCDDCTSPERICSVTAFFERPSKGLMKTYVVLVDKNLGL